jgi:hypothetical protein
VNFVVPLLYPQGPEAAPPRSENPFKIKSEPGGIRTRDPLIKSQMLYRLSYGLAREGGT